MLCLSDRVGSGASGDTIPDAALSELLTAVKNGHIEQAAAILEQEPTLVDSREDGRTPIFYGIRWGLNFVVEFLLKHGANVNAVDSDGYTPLHSASQEGHCETVQLLLRNGAQINSFDFNGQTPLHIAATYDRIEVVSELLNNGADMNAVDSAGYTPLHLVASEGNLGVAKTLLEHGADINASDSDGRAPLHIAASERFEMVEILLKHGALLDATDHNGCTPLMTAALWNKIDIVRILVAAGAKLLLKDKADLGARDLAVSRDFAEVVEIIDQEMRRRLRTFLMGTCCRERNNDNKRSIVLMLPVDILGVIAFRVCHS